MLPKLFAQVLGVPVYRFSQQQVIQGKFLRVKTEPTWVVKIFNLFFICFCVRRLHWLKNIICSVLISHPRTKSDFGETEDKCSSNYFKLESFALHLTWKRIQTLNNKNTSVCSAYRWTQMRIAKFLSYLLDAVFFVFSHMLRPANMCIRTFLSHCFNSCVMLHYPSKCWSKCKADYTEEPKTVAGRLGDHLQLYKRRTSPLQLIGSERVVQFCRHFKTSQKSVKIIIFFFLSVEPTVTGPQTRLSRSSRCGDCDPMPCALTGESRWSVPPVDLSLRSRISSCYGCHFWPCLSAATVRLLVNIRRRNPHFFLTCTSAAGCLLLFPRIHLEMQF